MKENRGKKYMRKFKDLTDEEIKYFCKDVFGAFKFDKIKRTFNEHIECIDVSFYAIESEPNISDRICLQINGLSSNDYNIGKEDTLWQQFLYARGICSLAIDNPYLDIDIKKEKNTDKLIHNEDKRTSKIIDDFYNGFTTIRIDSQKELNKLIKMVNTKVNCQIEGANRYDKDYPYYYVDKTDTLDAVCDFKYLLAGDCRCNLKNENITKYIKFNTLKIKDINAIKNEYNIPDDILKDFIEGKVAILTNNKEEYSAFKSLISEYINKNNIKYDLTNYNRYNPSKYNYLYTYKNRIHSQINPFYLRQRNNYIGIKSMNNFNIEKGTLEQEDIELD